MIAFSYLYDSALHTPVQREAEVEAVGDEEPEAEVLELSEAEVAQLVQQQASVATNQQQQQEVGRSIQLTQTPSLPPTPPIPPTPHRPKYIISHLLYFCRERYGPLWVEQEKRELFIITLDLCVAGGRR